MRTSSSNIVFAAALALTASACEFFEDDEIGDESGTEDEDTGEPEVSEGFRVFPKYMLADVPAIVTIESVGVPATECPLDDAAAGGYLCDSKELPGPTAMIRVERDGFETAIRNPQLVPFIEELEVHVVVEGGPTGVWSACVPTGGFSSCEEVCANEMRGCLVTDCGTEEPEWPVASYETFVDEGCLERIEGVVAGCEESLPQGGVGGVRCCCAP